MTFDEELDTILTLLDQGKYLDNGGVPQAKQEIKQLIADKVIGEDVDAYKMSSGSMTKLNIYQYQNSLRNDQRKLLGLDK